MPAADVCLQVMIRKEGAGSRVPGAGAESAYVGEGSTRSHAAYE